tara:strand:+ start:354 stop:1688 length:1335 start_codon:yes stop_codon:yes gene_type:complete
MHNSSNKSKGYMPVSSGPNMTGFDMGKTSSLMEMMQTGGQTSRGATMLARSRQRRSDMDTLEDIQSQEEERQKKGGFFGSLAGFAGGVIGGALGGPFGATLGSGLFRGIGESVGAGKPRDYDASDTVFAQQQFRDVNEASKEYNKGILGRSLLEGAKTGLTAGFTPGGGIYGQYNPLTASGQEGISRAIMGKGVTGYGGTQSLFNFAKPEYLTVDSIVNPEAIADTGIIDRAVGIGQSFRLEDGGLISMQTGGGVGIQSILSGAGIGFATPEQLAMFQKFDKTGINRATQATSQNLIDATLGEGIGSASGGFGAQQSAVSKMVQDAGKSLEQRRQDEIQDFQSQTLADLAMLEEQGVEFTQAAGQSDQFFGQEGTGYMGSGFGGGAFGGDTGTTTGPQTSPLVNPGTYVGEQVSYNGQNYQWDGSSWQITTGGLLAGTGFGGGG